MTNPSEVLVCYECNATTDESTDEGVNRELQPTGDHRGALCVDEEACAQRQYELRAQTKASRAVSGD